MNPLHLIWIIPLAGSFGFAIAGILFVSKRADQTAMQLFLHKEK